MTLLIPRPHQPVGATSYEIACHATGIGEAAQVSVDGIACADGWVGLIDDGRTRTVVVKVVRGQPSDASDRRRR